jgi:DNA/RNA endonuclease YhcR with UshA esterase domain
LTSYFRRRKWAASFTLVIWGNDRSKFDNPETTYRGKRVCVTGKISAFKGVPEVVANDPAQIKVP